LNAPLRGITTLASWLAKSLAPKASPEEREQVFAFVRHKTTAEIAASLFRFHGLNFICTWDRAVDELLPLSLPDVSGGSVIHHLNVFNAKPENVALCFDWSGTTEANSSSSRLVCLKVSIIGGIVGPCRSRGWRCVHLTTVRCPERSSK
jgi:hypothetical protein